MQVWHFEPSSYWQYRQPVTVQVTQVAIEVRLKPALQTLQVVRVLHSRQLDIEQVAQIALPLDVSTK